MFRRLVASGEGRAITHRRSSSTSSTSYADPDAAAVLRPVHGRPPAHENRGHGGGGRGPAARMASASGMAGGGPARPSAPPAPRTRPGNGRRPAATPRRGVPGARLSAALDWAAARPDLNEVERDFLSESRRASERDAEKQRRTNRRLRGLLVGTAVFLLVALLAGGLALVQRGRARDEALRAELGRMRPPANWPPPPSPTWGRSRAERPVSSGGVGRDGGRIRACARGRGGPPSGAAGVPGLAQGGARRRDRHKRRRQGSPRQARTGPGRVGETDCDKGCPHAPRTRGARSRHRLQPRRDAAGHRWPRPDSAAVGRGERRRSPRSARASGPVLGAAFNPDGSLLATSSGGRNRSDMDVASARTPTQAEGDRRVRGSSRNSSETSALHPRLQPRWDTGDQPWVDEPHADQGPRNQEDLDTAR